LQERRSVPRETRRKYRRVPRGEKAKILDEFTGLTEYNRKYALQHVSELSMKQPQGRTAGAPRGSWPYRERSHFLLAMQYPP
jgi:hypothetical protein